MKYILFFSSLFTVLLFILTAPPTICLGDSGEIASAAFNLGIGHPPGYPVYILLGKISTLLPIGDEAFRINFMSIILSVFIFLILFLTIRKMLKIFYKDKSKLINFISLMTSFIFVFSNDFYCVATNVKGGIYVFNCLIILTSIYSIIRYYFDNEKKFLYFTLYCIGFMPVAHQTSLFIMLFLLFIILYVVYKRKEKNILGMLIFFLLSFMTSWFYLFIRYKRAMNVWANIDSLSLLFDFITRKVYVNQNDPNFTFTAGISKFLWYLKNYFQNFNVLLLFLIYGFVVLYKKSIKVFLLNIFIFFTNLFLIILFTYNGNSPEFYYVNKPFYLINNLLSMLYVSIGVHLLLFNLKNKSRLIYNICLIVFMIFTLGMISINTFNNNYSRKFLAYDHGINILKTINDNDYIIGKSDIYIFNVQYLKQVKKQYLNITVYDQSGNVLDTSLYKNAKRNGVLDLKKQEQAELDLYLKNKNNVFYMDMTSYPEYNLMTRPYGILNKLTENTIFLKNTENLMSIYSIRDLFNCKNNDFFNRYVIGKYLVREAEYAAINQKTNEFNFYKNYSEAVAGDVPNIIKNIASIYFHNLMDVRNTMNYLEKSIELDNYDLAALNLIITLYHELGMKEREIYWLKFYYEKEWRKEIKEKILNRINYIGSAR
ncbi:MAG: DUF2723 domain-containing protein [Candidatus Goldbacteria bacterium]|nr:DUF2723 domain-containing protein [Candidatus Goldiibacteriota bacterium]